MKRSAAYTAVLDMLAREYRQAHIIETNHPFRDTFQRANEVVSVELCQGIWRTFRRGSDSMCGSHESREAAKAHALVMLGG